MYKILKVAFLLIINISFGFAQNNKALSIFLNNKLFDHASVGVLIRDLDGNELVSVNKSVSMTPASIMKIITTATALDALGNEFRYETSLSVDKNKIIVWGVGDPTLGSEDLFQNQKYFLSEWTEQIQKLKVNAPIEIYIQDNYFGYLGTSSKWVREDLGNYYAAGAYGISAFDNTYRIFFNTMDTGGVPVVLRTEPAMDDLLFLNMLKYNNTGKDNGYIWGEPFSDKRQLVGDIPAKRSSFSIKGDIPDPGLYLGKCLAKMLNSNGLKTGKIETGRMTFYEGMYKNVPNEMRYNDSEVFYTHYSPSLQDIIRVVNFKSNNHYAEHIIRTIGRRQNKDLYSDPLQEGIGFCQTYWANRKFDTSALFMYDGCGLSPVDAISPELMCDVLSYMYKSSRYSEAFLSSLPKAGMDGTVRNFLKDNRLSGKMYVKSGSIANVQSYAGYYIDGNKKYVFTIIVNRFSNDLRKDVVKAIETFLLGVLP